VANTTTLERIKNRKYVTIRTGNLGSRKESGQQQRGFPLRKLWGTSRVAQRL